MATSNARFLFVREDVETGEEERARKRFGGLLGEVMVVLAGGCGGVDCPKHGDLFLFCSAFFFASPVSGG